MTAAVGKTLKSTTNNCESVWDQYWDDLFSDTQKILNIASKICEVAAPIAEGVDLVA